MAGRHPQVSLANIDKIAEIANRHNVITVCDNTVATPILCNPFKHGVDVIVHSTSKYTTGQGLALGGILVGRNELNSKLIGNARYPQFNEPDESYHGLVYADIPLPLFTLRARLSLIRDFGATPAPFNSWLLIQGLETLAIRMEKHSNNALEVAKYLESNPKVTKVSYPGLKSHPQHDRAKSYFKDGLSSGLLSFEVEGLEFAKNILNNTKLFSIVVNIGDSKSIITHPASTTHMQVPADELEKTGVKQGLVRLSIGLESPADLIADLAQAIG